MGSAMRTNAVNYGIAFFIILMLNFLLPRLIPGDPMMAIYGEETLLAMTPELKAHIVNRFGLDEPLWKQFIIYLLALAKGDLGYSFYQNSPVLRVITSYLPWTFLLMGTALVLSTIFGIIAGIESGWRRGKKFDKAFLVGMMSLSGFPSFFVGIIFLLTFSVTLGILPLQGAKTAYSELSGFPLLFDIIKHLTLPLATLTVVFVSGSYLLTRNTMVTILEEPFILTAKAKGLTDRRVRYRHAGRNSMLPVLTQTGIGFGTRMITGALFVEVVFSYPGMGALIYNSLLMRDYPVLQGSLLVVTIFVLAINFSVDLLYGKIDPRIGNAR
jgi:peptide/nickel transport system permease protein